MSTKEPAMADNSITSVGKFHDVVHAYVGAHSDVFKATWITGTAAVMVEISNEMGTQFLKIEVTAIILIILLLLFVMKSYLTPIRSVVTIFMSVIWTVAITQLLFTDVLHAGVLWLLPILLLVICLGLGMDYDILLTTRIREYRFAKGMDNDEAIHQAVLHSGSVITICGVIMAGTFGTLMLSSTVLLQQMGFALCFAILVDALIVRTYIVPAAMHLMGEWNWKGPKFLHAKQLPQADEYDENEVYEKL
jgi:RND superfamily putative drug exporter